MKGYSILVSENLEIQFAFSSSHLGVNKGKPSGIITVQSLVKTRSYHLPLPFAQIHQSAEVFQSLISQSHREGVAERTETPDEEKNL